MHNADGEDTSTFDHGEDIFFEFDYLVKRSVERLTFCYTLTNAEGLEIFMSDKQDPANVVNSEIGTTISPCASRTRAFWAEVRALR